MFSLVLFSAGGLRTPLAVPGPYPGAFGMLPHTAGMNGELAGAAGAAAYAAGLHNMSPQMSAAAAAAVAAYGRSPMVSGRRATCVMIKLGDILNMCMSMYYMPSNSFGRNSSHKVFSPMSGLLFWMLQL